MSIGEKQIPLDRRITIAEASRLSGKSERTLRRWFHAGKLQATQEGGINSLLYFDISQIAALAGSTAILERLDLLEARIAALEPLEARIQELERLIEDLRRPGYFSVHTEKPEYRTRPASSSTIKVTQAIKSDLPPGLVPAATFAKLHGIAETTIRKAIASGRIPAISGRWQHGRAMVTTALDVSGRARFYTLYHDRIDFQACPDCPHENEPL